MHDSTRVLVVGAGGHAKVVIDVARAAGFRPVAALDQGKQGSTCNGVEVVGGDELAERFFDEGVTSAVIALGDNQLRVRIGDALRHLGFMLPTIVHPTAVVSPSARLGEGTVVMPHAVVNASAEVGRLAVINTGAIIEHDCLISEGAHVAPGSVLGGNVSVGRCTLIGIGSAIRPETKVADCSVVGAGSTVIRDVGNDEVVLGSPAKARCTS